MANYYVSNPIEVVSVGEKIKVRVLEIDEERGKVSLSMKNPTAPNASQYGKRNDSPVRGKASEGGRRLEVDENTSSIRSNITFS
jgi:uncharacterized protein